MSFSPDLARWMHPMWTGSQTEVLSAAVLDMYAFAIFCAPATCNLDRFCTVSVPFLYRCCTVRFRIRQRLLHLLNQLSGTVDIASFHANIQDTVEGNGIRLDLDTKPHSVSYNAAKCYKVLQWKPCGMRIDNKICSACSPISASNLIQPSTSIH